MDTDCSSCHTYGAIPDFTGWFIAMAYAFLGILVR